jgi:Zn-finger nucleic acid-binding protein
MALGTLNCPNCGGVVSSDATQCQYCGARLATISCPKCFGLAFLGSKFCPHCGAGLAAVSADGTSILSCPRCEVQMQQRTVGQTLLTECDKCGGLWIDAITFERICDEREDQVSVLSRLMPPDPHVTIEPNPRYLPCPRCGQLMNRLNFAHCSGVIIDVCKPHGIWFDRDELRRIIEFIRAGGMDRARDKEKRDLDEARRALASAKQTVIGGQSQGYSAAYDDAELLSAFRLAGGLVRRVIK